MSLAAKFYQLLTITSNPLSSFNDHNSNKTKSNISQLYHLKPPIPQSFQRNLSQTTKFFLKKKSKKEPWKVGLAKACKPGISTLSNVPLDNRDDTLLLLSPYLFLFRDFFLEELKLPPTHPGFIDTHAPIA